MSATVQDGDLGKRFNWILLSRAIISLVCAGGVALATHPDLPLFYTVIPFGVAFLLNFVFLLLRRWRPVGFLVILQLLLDFLIVTAVIYTSNAAESIFTFLYFLIILEAAMMVSRGASLVLASLATIGCTGVSILYYLYKENVLVIPFGEFLTEGIPEIILQDKILFLVGQMVAYHAVALLGGILAEDLRRLTLLHDLLLENMPEGIITLDSQNRVAFLNSAARELLGISPSVSIEGRPVHEAVATEMEAIADMLVTQENSDWELSLPGPSGPRSVHFRVSATTDRRGRRRGAVGVLTDLTLRKRLESAERTAEHLEGLREVAAGLAHEIRNPLASIGGCVQEISRGDRSAEDVSEMIAIIRRESSRLDDILQEFLQFTGMRDPVPGPVDLEALLDEVILLLENREGTPVPAIEKDYDGRIVVQGDLRQLQQVFLNLGINAIEASGTTGFAGPLRFEVRPSQITLVGSRTVGKGKSQRVLVTEGVEIAVHDQAGGMDPAILPKVFTPFFTTKRAGTGLGLAVVNRIVRGHGGEVEVENRPGKGCTFRVRIPVEVPGTQS